MSYKGRVFTQEHKQKLSEAHKKLTGELAPRYKHGYTKHYLYRVWCWMKSRCYNVNNTRYMDYGQRGILVCPQWLNDPVAFIKWASKHWKPGLMIDRIDNNGNYEPSNCRFVTEEVQNNNRRPRKNFTNLPAGVIISGKKFAAQMKIGNKQKWLGTFSTPEEASRVYQMAKHQYRISLGR